MRSALLILMAFVLIIPFSHGLTASIGNARMILRADVDEGETIVIDKSILVKNVNNVSVKVTLEPDDMYKRIINIFDDEFILQPNQSRNAKFTITLKSGGRYEGKILVSFVSADPNVKESSVGLSSSIIILADGPVTEEYYKVMGKENTGEDIREDTEEEETELDAVIEDYGDIGEGEGNVSVSIGSFSTTIAEKEAETEQKPISPLIGILIVAGVIITGLGIFFIIKTVK